VGSRNAEAQIILAKGQSEAEAMKVKAAAFHEYNQAAVLDKLLTGMPDVVRAMAEPLSKVGPGACRRTEEVNGSQEQPAERRRHERIRPRLPRP
jgi:uncharacterized membrane protein YqiK